MDYLSSMAAFRKGREEFLETFNRTYKAPPKGAPGAPAPIRKHNPGARGGHATAHKHHLLGHSGAQHQVASDSDSVTLEKGQYVPREYGKRARGA